MSLTIIRNGMPVILVTTHIGYDSMYGEGVTADNFVKELNLLENSNYTECEVWINSVGGSVMDAMQMYHAITSSSMTVNTRNVGIAASSAGWLMQAGKKRIANYYSKLMMHPSSGGSDKALDAIDDSIIDLLSKRCNKSSNWVKDSMEVETWIKAKDCLIQGFCDVVDENCGVSLDFEIENSTPFAAYNKLRLVVNKLVENKKDIKMIKVMNALNLSEDASEDSVLKEVNALKEQISTLTDSLKEKEDLIASELLAKENAEKERAAVELVENGIEAKKIEATAKDAFVNLAKIDFEGTKNAIAALPVFVAAKKLPIENKVEGENRNAWTYSDWEKKDGTGLVNMYKNDRESYDLLLKTHKEKIK